MLNLSPWTDLKKKGSIIKCEIKGCDLVPHWKFPIESVIYDICEYHARCITDGLGEIKLRNKELIFEAAKVLVMESGDEIKPIELEPLVETIIKFYDFGGPIHKVIEELENRRRKAVESGYERVRVDINGSIEITGIKVEEEEEEGHGVEFVPEQFD